MKGWVCFAIASVVVLTPVQAQQSGSPPSRALSPPPNDPEFPNQTVLSAMRVPEAWEYTTGDSSVIIGILDTGIDLDHPDLEPNIYRNMGEWGSNGVCFTDASTGTVVGDDIYRTNDGGTTWIKQEVQGVAPSIGFNAVSFVNNEVGVVVGTHGTILRTTDGGLNWIPQQSGTTVDLYDVCFTDTTTGTVVGEDLTILRTTNGGALWRAQQCTSKWGGRLLSVSFFDANHGIIVGTYDEILHTSNGGRTWITELTDGIFARLYDVCMVDNFTATAVGEYRRIFRTTDCGVSWSKQENWVQTPGDYNLLCVSFADPNNGLAAGTPVNHAATNSVILRTTNGGANWICQESGTTEWFWNISYPDPDHATILGTGGTILHTTTGGRAR